MTKRIILMAVLFLSLTSCATEQILSSSNIRQAPTGTTNAVSQIYQRISQEKAKEFMSADISSVIVDVRHQDEYDSGHIPGAILIPNESIDTKMPAELPDKDQQTVLTARKLERFLTQPFFTTYQFTGMEGRSVDLEKTIEGCERILAGEFNYLNENDFFMVGDVDEVAAKTKAKKEAYEKALAEDNA